MIITPELIEKAARARWGDPHEFPWDEMSEPCKNIWRAEARRSILAILPDIVEAIAKVAEDFDDFEYRLDSWSDEKAACRSAAARIRSLALADKER